METKHTPGPWFAELGHDRTFNLYARTPRMGTQLLGEFYNKNMGDDLPALANLTAAAAAPALLEALKTMTEIVDRYDFPEALQAARQAISQATGEA